MVQVKVEYSEETNISKSNNGSVFSGGGQTLWIKLNDHQVMEVGTGRLIAITARCAAYPVKTIIAQC